MIRHNRLTSRVWDWVEDRTAVGVAVRWFLSVAIPRDAHTYYLGGTTLFLFIVQAISGTLLALYYQPSPEAAYDSIVFIMTAVNFGWLIRSFHHWSANLMILMAFLHMLRVFWHGVYKPPREITWVVGALLGLVTLGFGFTGYLLPWDQRAFWATTVGTDIAGSTPLIGDLLREFLRGGPEVSALTLSRFFGIHVLVLPAAMVILLAAHLYLIHHHGIADPPYVTIEAAKRKFLPFFPNYVLGEFIAWYAVLALLIVLSSLFPAGLEDKADPLVTPPHIKPEWYFLGVYQFLKLTGELRSFLGPQAPLLVGLAVPGIVVILMVVLPFVDRNPERRPGRRSLAIAIAGVIVVGLIILTYLGQIS